MTEVAPNKAFNYWLEALKAKYFGEGRPYQRAEFDKLLGNYSVRVKSPQQSNSCLLTQLGRY